MYAENFKKETEERCYEKKKSQSEIKNKNRNNSRNKKL